MLLILPSLLVVMRKLLMAVMLTLAVWLPLAVAGELAVPRSQQLDYGEVLFDYYSQDYFNALVSQRFVASKNNTMATSAEGRVLEGGMLLSYGLPRESALLFDQVLASTQPESTANRAWYYLAKLQYHKGNTQQALASLLRVQGEIPADLHPEYHYLASLLNISGQHLVAAESLLQSSLQGTPFYPYLLFNLAIAQLKQGEQEAGLQKLMTVAAYSGQSDELLVLADRAKHAIAQVSIQQGSFSGAWLALQNIRTTGLYSNRGLLSYAWTAIKRKDFKHAIAGLMALDRRSIAIAEVQEAKVLLGYLFEQQQAPRRALKHYLLAEQEFERGIAMVKQARAVIAGQDVPREFVTNLKAIMDESDWYGSQPSVDYKKLTPFLIDLMASNAFQETLRELADLYAIQNNLYYWHSQRQQHRLVVNNKASLQAYKSIAQVVEQGEALTDQLQDQFAELHLYSLSFQPEQQRRFAALEQSVDSEMTLLTDRLKHLSEVKKPYLQPAGAKQQVEQTHRQIERLLGRTNDYIAYLEPVMRGLVDAELSKHEERMNYYWAQARLAKARLFDTTLMTLDQAKQRNGEQP
ncbi:tetratricopeptide repeat protein [Sinobacterium caligoides]|nr:hypothetical protein [Sinobacterium caligoides]